MKIKRGDQVVVISGVNANDAPRRVTEVIDGGEKLLVEGVNLVFRHVKRGHPKSPQGGRLRKEMPIHASKVMYYCEKCQRGVRLGYRFTTDGAKERFCKKCSAAAGSIAPARKAHAEAK
ncbi:50S ribosomal protein L24 [Caulifigura coniformis]|uniref:Large ribosomal subunit protein uL24 n=1 Tax=Caulifigura coniformis TaxID=2527983 RepID=A0A517SE78_9PLAN|nr:50S ribosomal protein L24 [Caulifigura coniformis]QDT54418.1 50S ribosomal protein L24 [Caulifigura coniformis]